MMSSQETSQAAIQFGRIQNDIEQGKLKLENKKKDVTIADDNLRKEFPDKIDLEKLPPSQVFVYAALRARHDSAVRDLDEAEKALVGAKRALQELFDNILQSCMQASTAG